MNKRQLALSLVALCSLTFTQNVFAQNAPPTGGADAPEPLMKERMHINGLIDEARKRNIGVQAYLQQMEAIEDKAFSGSPEAALRPMVDDLTNKLNAQLRESVVLKYLKPVPLTRAQRMAQQSGGGVSSLGWDHMSEGEKRTYYENQYRSKNDWNNQSRYGSHESSYGQVRSNYGKVESTYGRAENVINAPIKGGPSQFADSKITQRIESDKRSEPIKSWSSKSSSQASMSVLTDPHINVRSSTGQGVYMGHGAGVYRHW
jgi:hypothetical protein